MNLHKLILTKNECYKCGEIMTPKGILVHSTGANNPYLKRYVGPNDGLLGNNKYNNHWNQLRPDGIQICVHAFIGKLEDGTIATYQTLPWNYVGWHSGSGSKGYENNANNTGYIGFEICEDNLTDANYFNKIYQEAIDLCAYLCKTYNIKPESPYLICHSEGSKLGIASAHGDVMHWFPKHGKSMDTFRADVKAKMNSSSTSDSTASNNAKTYVLKTKVNGYNSANDAKNKKNAKTILAAGTYYIYSKYPNGYSGMMNITTDKTGKVPGCWINPSENVVATWTPKKDDKVIVNGSVTQYGTAKGNIVKVTNKTMYITQLLSSKIYTNYIGVSLKKGGTRYGWVNRDSIKKA